MYKIFHNNLGKPDAINRLSDGASLPFNSATKTFDESHPLTVELRAWEAIHGALDLSDRPPEPLPPPPPDWRAFRLALMGDIAYNRMRMTTLNTPGQLAGGRLENAASIDSHEWAVIAGLWGVLLNYTPADKKPTATEIERWNAIASGANMPFSFSTTDGMMIV
jgi:hypothetical protein